MLKGKVHVNMYLSTKGDTAFIQIHKPSKENLTAEELLEALSDYLVLDPQNYFNDWGIR